MFSYNSFRPLVESLESRDAPVVIIPSPPTSPPPPCMSQPPSPPICVSPPCGSHPTPPECGFQPPECSSPSVCGNPHEGYNPGCSSWSCSPGFGGSSACG